MRERARTEVDAGSVGPFVLVGLGTAAGAETGAGCFSNVQSTLRKCLDKKGGEGDGYCALFYISKLKRVGKYHARFKRVMTHYVIAIRQGCRLGWRSGVSFLVLGIVRVYGGLTGKDFRDEVGLC